MQENRSFDTYFGTYPGANGIPMQNGAPTVCVNDPQTGQCIKPYHDAQNLNHGGPHGAANATADIDGGKMDGFIAQAKKGKGSCTNPNDPACSRNGRTDVMGYHTAHEIPNYWSYAQNFVLQDHMFEPDASWSLPAHLFMVSGWSANFCPNGSDTSSTGRHREPLGQDVSSSVDIPVMADATLRADPRTHIKGEVFHNMLAIMTGFARWIPAIDFDEGSSIPLLKSGQEMTSQAKWPGEPV